MLPLGLERTEESLRGALSGLPGLDSGLSVSSSYVDCIMIYLKRLSAENFEARFLW